MGAKQSTSTSFTREEKKIENERRKNVQNHIISQRKEEISAIENHVISNAGVQDVKVLKEVIQATTYAQNQLERGGKAFNKGDLVAIIVALDNQQVNNIDKLNCYRIEDLNALIRVIIYDSKNFVSQNNMITDRTNDTNITSSSNEKVLKSNALISRSEPRSNIKENNYSMVIAPPLPPKPESKNNLRITYDAPPSYALVRR
jgi:hypothetical protein